MALRSVHCERLAPSSTGIGRPSPSAGRDGATPELLGPLPSVEPVPAFLEPTGVDAKRAEDPSLFVV